MAEGAQAHLVRAIEVAHDVEARRSANGVHFATFGETGVPAPDLQSMIEAVPTSISAALNANTYFFVPLALREPDGSAPTGGDQAMVASAYSAEYDSAAICHRNVALDKGRQGVFISTRLTNDRFALGFEFFINVAHAFVDHAGVPQAFSDLVWEQATGGARGPFGVVRGETSIDAFETRNLALGRTAMEEGPAPQPAAPRRGRAFGSVAAPADSPKIDEKERGNYVQAAFSDAVAIYLLSLAVDFDYAELREREYPLLTPAGLAARLRLVADLFPPNPGYEFAIRYRRKA